jgi:hypothetical protein
MGSDESDLRCGQCGSRLFMNHLESCPLGPGIVGQRVLSKIPPRLEAQLSDALPYG